MTLSLVLLIILSCGILFSPIRFRRSILLSAVLSAPTSLASFIFVPEYWNPKRIVPFEIGPEDMIFSFSTGGMIWLIVINVLHKNIRLDINMRTVVKRYTGILIIGSAIYLIWLFMVLSIMTATVITVFIIGIWILNRRREYWLIGVVGALGFCIFYASALRASYTVFPAFPGQWNVNNLFGFYMMGMPVEEIIWGIACGAVWPLIIAYLLNVQLIKKLC